MDELFSQLSLGGILAVLVVREVLTFISSRKEAEEKNGEEQQTSRQLEMIRETHCTIREIHLTLKELHKWHDVRDEDQVPVWYVRKGLERAVGKLNDAVGQLEKAASQQANALDRLVEAANSEQG